GPPFLRLGALQSCESGRRLLFARWNLLTQLGKPLLHARIAQGGSHCRIEFGDDGLGRTLRSPHSMPHRDVEPRQAGLVHCRNVGRVGKFALRRDRKSLYFSASNLRQRIRRLIEEKVNSARQKIEHCRCGAAIGHELELCACQSLEIKTPDVSRTASASGALHSFAWILAKPCNQILEGRGR